VPSKLAQPYEIRRSAIQGRGAFATEDIRKGRRYTEYLGEAISHEEADRRYDDDDANGRHHTFLFILDDDTVLDARNTRCDAKYINHSCDPNSETVIEDGHIWVEAIKPIKKGDELLYDYQFEFDDDYDADDIRYYACRCGSEKCRGTIIKVPAYLKSTVKKWLAGDDVKRPPKPGTKAALRLKEAKKKAAAKKKLAAEKKRAANAAKRAKKAAGKASKKAAKVAKLAKKSAPKSSKKRAA
jgi:hypothetical protein